MDSVEFETNCVIEKARKFFQRKQSHYSNFPFLHSARVPQQTHTNTGSSSANDPGSLQFNQPLLINSRIGNTYCNTQVKNTYNNIYYDMNLLFFLSLYYCI